MRNLLLGVKRHLVTKIRIPRYFYVLIPILLVAVDLRIQSVAHTVIDTPVRADALEYVLYAHNLKNYGVFSRSDTLAAGGRVDPIPDARRVPMYPLFLTVFLDKRPTNANIIAVTRAQAVISVLTVLLVFLVARRFLSIPLALVASALTAISPHLVTMNVYVLSETLFCFLVVLAVFLTTTISEKSGVGKLVLVGLTLGAAALTHPMLLYFVIPLSAFLLSIWGWRAGWRKVAILVLGFGLLYGGWVGRNLGSLGVPGDNTLMLAGLRSGAYADMMYRNDPRSYAYPYHFDPHYEETTKNLPSVLAAIGRSFEESPLEQLRWYLLGKPLMLWSWSNIEGPGDVFIYPVVSTPYNYLPQFKTTHAFMRATHWFLVALMAVGIVVAWLPQRWSGLSAEARFIARAISILLLYHAAVMMAGFPLPRYAISMRPFLHLMSMLPLAVASAWLARKWLSRPATG